MQTVITSAQMREVDRRTTEEYATPSVLLMESAAATTLWAIKSRFSGTLKGKRARVLCGPGNNGGDGAALARQLASAGVHTDVILLGKVELTKGDARVNFETTRRLAGFKAGSMSLPSRLTLIECESTSDWEELAGPSHNYDLLVDALFGTGLTRPLEGIFIQVIEHLTLIREARDRAGEECPLIVSLDIPSGLNADLSRTIGPTVKADLTVTFTAPKPANVLSPACFFGGELIIANIGSPEALVAAAGSKLFLVEEEDARAWLMRTRYTPDSYKNKHGHVLVIAGSPDYSGAAALCANAAMRSGAGLVTVAVPTSAQASVAARAIPEVMTTALAETDRGAVSDAALEHALKLSTRASVIALGPGLTAEDERTRTFVRSMIERRTNPMVVDADGLNCLSPWPADLRGSAALPLILTPHPGEMSRLMGLNMTSQSDGSLEAVREFAVKHEVIVLLKGARSLVAAPDGRVFVNPNGNAGLGTAGAGDTLTGLIAGFVAQAIATLRDPAEALWATIAALFVGGLAGDLAARELGMRSMVASDVREQFSTAIRLLDSVGESPKL